jgi:hypothetical protein
VTEHLVEFDYVVFTVDPLCLITSSDALDREEFSELITSSDALDRVESSQLITSSDALDRIFSIFKGRLTSPIGARTSKPN